MPAGGHTTNPSVPLPIRFRCREAQEKLGDTQKRSRGALTSSPHATTNQKVRIILEFKDLVWFKK